MAFQIVSVTPDWPASPHYTASGETPIRIVNSLNGNDVFWVTTADDTVPSLDPERAGRIRRDAHQDLTLADGERLWLGTESNASSTLSVTLLY